MIKLDVRLFGSLIITKTDENGREKFLREEEFNSPALVCLLAYLLLNHRKTVSSNELVEVLWSEKERENPYGALKNQIYRLRTILKKLGDEDYVITGKKAYYINPEIAVETDVELFDGFYVKGRSDDTDTKILNYRQGLRLYKENFLKRHTASYWIISSSVLYESRFKKMIWELCQILEDRGNYEKMQHVAMKGIKIDPLCEESHYYLIKSLIAQKKYKLAFEHYKRTEKLLYENFDIEVADKLKTLWPILMEYAGTRENDIKKIRDELMSEEDGGNGLFFCDYETFKRLYKMRSIFRKRFGINIPLILITIDVKEGFPENERISRLIRAMNNMRELLSIMQKYGDAATRISRNQFLLMVPELENEDIHKVTADIDKKYALRYSKEDVEISYIYKE